jgi:hypothetical protein
MSHKANLRHPSPQTTQIPVRTVRTITYGRPHADRSVLHKYSTVENRNDPRMEDASLYHETPNRPVV